MTPSRSARLRRIGSAPDTFLGSSHQQARDLIDRGAIGRVVSGTCAVMSSGMETWHPNPDFFFLKGGGPVLDLGPYYISNLVQLPGPVARVAALAATPSTTRVIGSAARKGQSIPVEAPTTIHALLEFAGGAVISFQASWDVWQHDLEPMALYGSSEGTLRLTRHAEPADLPDWDHRLGPANRPANDGRHVADCRVAGLADMATAITKGRPQSLQRSACLARGRGDDRDPHRDPARGRGTGPHRRRADPAQSGEGGAIADIGTHAAHLAHYVSGLPIRSVAAELTTFVGGRAVDDNAHVRMRLGDHARGMLWASQVASGSENEVRLRVMGDEAGLDWSHADPNRLRLTRLGAPSQILSRGGPGFQGSARVPSGHPEGCLEAFASIHADAADAIVAGRMPDGLPGLQSGLDGMRFIHACIRSSRQGGVWQDLDA